MFNKTFIVKLYSSFVKYGTQNDNSVVSMYFFSVTSEINTLSIIVRRFFLQFIIFANHNFHTNINSFKYLYIKINEWKSRPVAIIFCANS